MEALSHLVKVTLPGYLSSLPVPESVGAIFSLPVRDWIRLLPFAGTVTFFAWTAYTKFLPDKKGQTVNKCIMKSSSKVVHSFDIEDLGSKVSFCRCWRSKKFPYCDGSHNAHNEEHCDNVGPLVLKKKDA